MGTSQKGMPRRGFLKKSAYGLGLGLSSLGYTGGRNVLASAPAVPDPSQPRLPREVWIACVNTVDMPSKNVDDRINKLCLRMEKTLPYKPDIICLPEACINTNGVENTPPLSEVVETPPGPITQRFATFARDNHCHVILPIDTVHQGRYYNAAVVIDRTGTVLGEYQKIHTTPGEMDKYNASPGPLDPPVFELDCAKIGVQICFDLEYLDGWQKLNQKGAEIVFWPSAFAGGRKLNMLAQMFHYVVASSTWKTRTKICDIDGSEVAKTGIWEPGWCCGPVNLEKVFLHTWPFCKRFDEVKAKYGRKVKITTFHEEEWSIIESRSAEVKVADVLKEFEMKTFDEYMKEAKIIQDQQRP